MMNPYKEALSVPGDVLIFMERGNTEDKTIPDTATIALMYIYSTSLVFKKFKNRSKNTKYL